MDKDAIFRELETIQNLPTLPVIITKLNQAVEDPTMNAERISKIIQDDPAMMARILKTVNSVFYGVSQPVSSIAQAVALLGFIAVKNIAITTSVFSTFDIKDENDFNREEYWRHSINVGIAINVLYEHLLVNITSRPSRDLLHLSGLVHGIGIIVFEQFFHDKFMVAMELAQKDNIPLVEAEEQVIGANHCEVGAWLAQKWNLPEPVVECVRWHYDPEQCESNFHDIVNLCHTAKFICVLEKLGDYGETLSPFKKSVLKDIGLQVKEITTIVDHVKEEAKNSEVLLALAKD